MSAAEDPEVPATDAVAPRTGAVDARAGAVGPPVGRRADRAVDGAGDVADANPTDGAADTRAPGGRASTADIEADPDAVALGPADGVAGGVAAADGVAAGAASGPAAAPGSAPAADEPRVVSVVIDTDAVVESAAGTREVRGVPAAPSPRPARRASRALTVAIVGLVLSLVVGWAFPVGVVALVLAIRALRRPGESRGVAVWALCLSILSLVYSAGWLWWAVVQFGITG